MVQVVCDEIGPGMRPSERTVAVKDISGRRHFLRALCVRAGYREAAYNVAVSWYEAGEAARAVGCYERILDGEPGCCHIFICVFVLQPVEHGTRRQQADRP